MKSSLDWYYEVEEVAVVEAVVFVDGAHSLQFRPFGLL